MEGVTGGCPTATQSSVHAAHTATHGGWCKISSIHRVKIINFLTRIKCFQPNSTIEFDSVIVPVVVTE